MTKFSNLSVPLPSVEGIVPPLKKFLGQVGSRGEMLKLSGGRGDWCVRTDEDGVAYALWSMTPLGAWTWEVVDAPAGGVVNVKDFGATGNGTTDDAANIAKAITACAGSRAKLFFPAGTYKILSGLSWDMSAHSVSGDGAVIDATGMSSGTAFAVSGKAAKGTAYNHTGYLYSLDGLRILGPTSSSTTVDGITVDDTSGADGGTFSHLYVDGFRDQLVVKNNNWLLRFENCAFGHAVRRNLNLSPLTNAGENYSFDRCAFYGSHNTANTATALYTSGNPDAYFYACSFDYNDIEIDHNGGIVNLIGCHIENGNQGTFAGNPMIYVSSVGGGPRVVLTVSGGSITPTEASPGRSHLIEHRSASTAKVYVTMTGVSLGTYDKNTWVIRNLASTPPVFRVLGGSFDNAGLGLTAATLGEVPNLLYNGCFEDSTSLANPGWGSQGTGTLATCAIDTDSPLSGTRSLHIADADTNSALVFQHFPVLPDRRIFVRGFYKVSSFVSGSLNIRLAWFTWDRTAGTAAVAATTTRMVIGNLATITANTSGYVPFATEVTPPKGAVFGYLDFQTINFVGSFWADEVIVNDV